MKKFLSAALLLSLLLVTLVSCAGGEFTVTYVYGDGRDNTVQGVIPFTSPSRPNDPVRENYIFSGWYTDKELTEPYSFRDTVTSPITLYAGWYPDYEKLSSAVSAFALDACVTVKVIHLERVGLMLTPSASSVGSGAILKERAGYYYLLTNSHVVELEEGCVEREYTVSDAYGNEYEGELVLDSPERDLACIRFARGERELSALELAENAAVEGDTVVAIGSPQGKPNVITFGTVRGIREIDMQEGSAATNVDFPVIWHSAYVDHGSSGGALLDIELKVVGITFATSQGKDGKFAFGFTIPKDTVAEFLNEALGAR